MSQRVGRLIVGGYHTPTWRPYTFAILIAAFTLLVVGTILFDPSIHELLPIPKGETEGDRRSDTTSPHDLLVYTVRPGDTLVTIGKQHRISWQVLRTINQEMLMLNVELHCGGLEYTYTHDEGRTGLYCNHLVFDEDGTPLVFPNTLRPGDLLLVPQLP